MQLSNTYDFPPAQNLSLFTVRLCCANYHNLLTQFPLTNRIKTELADVTTCQLDRLLWDFCQNNRTARSLVGARFPVGNFVQLREFECEIRNCEFHANMSNFFSEEITPESMQHASVKNTKQCRFIWNKPYKPHYRPIPLIRRASS